jgi:hypothetical protein
MAHLAVHISLSLKMLSSMARRGILLRLFRNNKLVTSDDAQLEEKMQIRRIGNTKDD